LQEISAIFALENLNKQSADENDGVIEGTGQHDGNQKQRENADDPFIAALSFAHARLFIVGLHW
jgi:hypothetical protein